MKRNGQKIFKMYAIIVHIFPQLNGRIILFIRFPVFALSQIKGVFICALAAAGGLFTVCCSFSRAQA